MRTAAIPTATPEAHSPARLPCGVRLAALPVLGGGAAAATLIRLLIRLVIYRFLFRTLGLPGTIAVVVVIALAYFLYTRRRR